MGVLVFLVLFLAMSGHSSALVCLCKDGVGDATLQKALDYACGAGADCTQISQGGSCFNPNTVKAHCDYAVNSYFQKKGQVPDACVFAGAATTSSSAPASTGSCALSSNSGNTGTPSSNNTSGSTTAPPTGTSTSPPGTSTSPPGTSSGTSSPPGTSSTPPGTSSTPPGTSSTPPGTSTSTPGTSTTPGTVTTPSGTTTATPGTTPGTTPTVFNNGGGAGLGPTGAGFGTDSSGSVATVLVGNPNRFAALGGAAVWFTGLVMVLWV